MRTTVTLDDDVAARLSHLQKAQKKSFKAVLNQALREGLKQMTSSEPRRKKYQTRTADLGRCLVGNLDDVADALAIAEGESFQ